ncbi:MAG: hypothetical protein M1818_003516 [Claussenomyces sp. TS43310]|nr:MAG: hypothetical protein M1818_003516 [Claussenomyces sp. TS43310]
MCRFSTSPLDGLTESIPKILDISKTQLCTVHVGIKDARYFSTFRSRDGSRAQRITADDDGRIFAGASLFKVFIAAAASVMIEKLSANPSPTNKYRGLRNAWVSTFTDVFNTFSQDFKIGPLHGNPTILNLIVHCKGPCDINHLLFAPDGSPLLSANVFLRKISQYTEDTGHLHKNGIPWCEYSNANYILIALLIEVVSGMTLHAFLKEHIFIPLGMRRTYMTAEELSLVFNYSIPIEERVYPHLVSGTGVRRAIVSDKSPNLADTVEIATTGGYTCAADIGKFFAAVLTGLYGTSINGLFDHDFTNSLFIGLGSFDGRKDHGYTRFGLSTRFDETLPGSHSLNRLVSPESDSSAYTLEKTSPNDRAGAYYMAGSATGWACTAYLIPVKQIFVIVLTNTSGPLDASDVISRLCLQELLDLRPPKLDGGLLTRQPEGGSGMTLAERYRAHYVELAARIYEENALVFRKLEEDDKAPDTPTTHSPNVLGTYINARTAQSLEVMDKDNVLRVRLFEEGGSKSSKLMRFVRKGDGFRICSLDFPGLGIDCFGAWRNLEFSFEEKDGVIVCLTRRRALNLVDHFVRKV